MTGNDMRIPSSKGDSRGVKQITHRELNERSKKLKEDKNLKKLEKADRRAPVVSLVRVIVTVICVVFAVVAALWIPGTASKHEEIVNTNSERINDLTGQLDKLKTEKENIPEPEVLSKSIEVADGRAHELLDIQNEMINKVKDNSDENVLAYGKLVDKAKGFMTEGSLSGGDFLPHGRWFQAYDLQEKPNSGGVKEWSPLGQDRWKWSVLPVTDVTTDGEVPVIWQARFNSGENNGQVLAWVKGMYRPGVGLFHGFTKGVTAVGKEYMGATSPELAVDPDNKVKDAPDENEMLNDAIGALNDARSRGGSNNQGDN